MLATRTTPCSKGKERPRLYRRSARERGEGTKSAHRFGMVRDCAAPAAACLQPRATWTCVTQATRECLGLSRFAERWSLYKGPVFRLM